MRSVLGISHPAVTNLQHVGIVPVAWPGVRVEFRLLIHDIEHAVRAAVAGLPLDSSLPPILNVAGGAP